VHPAATVATAYQAACEPAVLTIGILAASDDSLVAPPPADGATLWVVEGFSMLTAIAASGTSQPVVCRSGTPSVVVVRLITAAAAEGWRIAVSSDFRTWRPTRRAYPAPACRTGRIPLAAHHRRYLASPGEGDPFTPEQVPETPWDPGLAHAMRQRYQRVSEECRLDLLLKTFKPPSAAIHPTRRSGQRRAETGCRSGTSSITTHLKRTLGLKQVCS
jgi:hypothetical protein